jgi:hypothetical protein
VLVISLSGSGQSLGVGLAAMLYPLMTLQLEPRSCARSKSVVSSSPSKVDGAAHAARRRAERPRPTRGDDHVHALFGRDVRDRPADPAVAAGDDRPLFRELRVHQAAPYAIFGSVA